MQVRWILILLGMVLALGAYSYFVEVKWKETKKEEERVAKRVLSVKAEEVSEIVLKRRDQSIRLVRFGDKQWKMVGEKEKEMRADSTSVEGLLSTLENLESQREVGEVRGGDEALYGLKNPELVVQVKGGQKGETELLLGDPTPIGSEMYAQRGGEKKIFLIPAHTKNSLTRSAESLRERRIFPELNPARVSTFTVHHTAPPLAFEKIKSVWGWKGLSSRQKGTVNATRLESLIAKVAAVKVENWLAGGDLSRYGLDKPALSFSWTEEKTTAERLSYILRIARKGDKIYAYTNNSQEFFELASYQYEDLAIKREDLQTPQEKKQGEKTGTTSPMEGKKTEKLK